MSVFSKKAMKATLVTALCSLFLVACDDSNNDGLKVNIEVEDDMVDSAKEPFKTENKVKKSSQSNVSDNVVQTATKIDHYTVYADGTAIDNDNGMMWMRCSLGQKWDGKTCVGKAKKYTWDEAFKAIQKLNSTGYAGYYRWQLPHIEDSYSLINCSTGFGSTGVEYPDIIPGKLGGKKHVQKCISDVEKLQSPTINQGVFPNTMDNAYWSSSTYAKGSYTAWGVDFSLGLCDNYGKNYRTYVRAVRLD